MEKTSTVVVKGIPIHTKILGEGRPVVILHGYQVDHHTMTACLEPVFAQMPGWQRIYFDLPGMGKTPGPDWLVNSDQMLEVVCGLIDQLLPAQHFTLVGLSYGGYLARGAAGVMGERVDGLALIVPAVIAHHAARTVPRHQTIFDPDLLNSLSPDEREMIDGLVYRVTPEIWEREQVETQWISLGDAEFLNRLQQEGYAFSEEVARKLDRFEKPALFILGRQDVVVGYRDAWALIEKYPRASFVILDEAGHLAHMEKAALFNQLIMDWLERVERDRKR
ncbi:MAG TPA: alpha/beta hydrolase [Anaerolineaceae bacterium]|nr:alpha/beta hydrolase [Anaerolineaceae bacterium]HPN54145.1 alpha/beta hydrolase [Anaerolineaceae bacterium]